MSEEDGGEMGAEKREEGIEDPKGGIEGGCDEGETPPQHPFIDMVIVGDCPSCRSGNTSLGKDQEGVDDPTVGVCEDCGYTWCLECGSGLAPEEICGHWGICAQCFEERDESGDCGVNASECPYIVEWLAGRCEGLKRCSWCESEIPTGKGVFAVGARLKTGIELVNREDGQPLYLQVVVAGRVVPALVVAEDSQAKREGNDLLFLVCGKECADVLSRALEEEKDIIERASMN